MIALSQRYYCIKMTRQQLYLALIKLTFRRPVAQLQAVNMLRQMLRLREGLWERTSWTSQPDSSTESTFRWTAASASHMTVSILRKHTSDTEKTQILLFFLNQATNTISPIPVKYHYTIKAIYIFISSSKVLIAIAQL